MLPLRTQRKKQTAETRATAKLKRAATMKKAQDLQADIDAINLARNKMAEEIAVKHNVKVDFVLRRLMAQSSFRAVRKVNLFNAKVHRICKKARSAGKKLGLEKARRCVLESPEFQNLTKEEEEALKAELLGDREHTKKGTRATNNAAAADARFTIGMIAEEIDSLAQRTGMVGFAMFSRGHIHDKTVPTECQSLGGLEFFQEIMGEPARDVAEKFELWCIAREKGLTAVDTLQSMRKQVNKFIHNGLLGATGSQKIAMNWVQYWKSIVLKKGVILKGWPLDGEVKNPATIHDVDSMTKLRDALQSGECFWHKMSGREREAAQEKYDEMVESGELEVKVRKPRKDKNVSR
ncbi:hypothetical protein B0H13DRAFT_1668142, partial [Mycena leptocephala]